MAFFVERRINGKRLYPPAIIEGTWCDQHIGLSGPKEFRELELRAVERMDMRMWRWQRVHHSEGPARILSEAEADALLEKYKGFPTPTINDYE